MEGRDGGRCQFDAGLGEGLLGELPRQLNLLLQISKELVQLGLNALAQAGKQERYKRRQRQVSSPRECLGMLGMTGLLMEFSGLQVNGKNGKEGGK